MPTEITTELVRSDREPTALDLIREVARDGSVSVEKLERLVALKEREDAKRAKAAFWASMAVLATKLPRVKKGGVIGLGAGKGSIPYAKYEDIDRVCRPLLAEAGLSVSFSTRVTPQGMLVMVLTVSHSDGHSEISERPAPPDPGPGRNGTQAQGSGEAYAKRYLFNAFFNIVTEGADDDGRATGFITDAQVESLHDMIHQLGSKWTPETQKKFLEWMGVDKVSSINSSDFKKAVTGLQAKARELK